MGAQSAGEEISSELLLVNWYDGDRYEIEELLHRTDRCILASVRRRVPDLPQANQEDIYQEVRTRIFRSRWSGQWDRRASLDTWINEIVRNCAADALRKFLGR